MVLLVGASLLMIYLAVDASCDCSIIDEMSRKIRSLKAQISDMDQKITDMKFAKKHEQDERKDVLNDESNNKQTNGEEEEDNLSWGPHKLAVIVPYRERFEELMEFLPYMHKFLNMQEIRHQFIVINQIDNHR